MDQSKGLAYCGLACCVCGENETCAGCRNEGCTDRNWCKNFTCCREKKLHGCWECESFPCTGSMLDKLRIHAFAQFIKENGEEELLRCLARNEQQGIVYHDKGQLTGDYDNFDTQDEIIDFIKNGAAKYGINHESNSTF